MLSRFFAAFGSFRLRIDAVYCKYLVDIWVDTSRSLVPRAKFRRMPDERHSVYYSHHETAHKGVAQGCLGPLPGVGAKGRAGLSLDEQIRWAATRRLASDL